MTDLDAAIIAALVSGEGEREVAARLGCGVAMVRPAVDRRMARFDPETVRASALEMLGELEQVLKARAAARLCWRKSAASRRG